MQTQRLNITLPYDIARDLRQTIPARKRSRFISEAVKDKLDKKMNLKREFIKSLKMNAKLFKEESKIWDNTIADGLDQW